jgi:hypothetical protein
LLALLGGATIVVVSRLRVNTPNVSEALGIEIGLATAMPVEALADSLLLSDLHYKIDVPQTKALGRREVMCV